MVEHDGDDDGRQATGQPADPGSDHGGRHQDDVAGVRIDDLVERALIATASHAMNAPARMAWPRCRRMSRARSISPCARPATLAAVPAGCSSINPGPPDRFAVRQVWTRALTAPRNATGALMADVLDAPRPTLGTQGP